MAVSLVHARETIQLRHSLKHIYFKELVVTVGIERAVKQ
jgi:hypothetical protein